MSWPNLIADACKPCPYSGSSRTLVKRSTREFGSHAKHQGGWASRKRREPGRRHPQGTRQTRLGGSVLHPLRNDARPVRGGDLLELADTKIPCGIASRLSLRTCHFPSSLSDTPACARVTAHTGNEGSAEADERIGD